MDELGTKLDPRCIFTQLKHAGIASPPGVSMQIGNHDAGAGPPQRFAGGITPDRVNLAALPRLASGVYSLAQRSCRQKDTVGIFRPIDDLAE